MFLWPEIAACRFASKCQNLQNETQPKIEERDSTRKEVWGNWDGGDVRAVERYRQEKKKITGMNRGWGGYAGMQREWMRAIDKGGERMEVSGGRRQKREWGRESWREGRRDQTVFTCGDSRERLRRGGKRLTDRGTDAVLTEPLTKKQGGTFCVSDAVTCVSTLQVFPQMKSPTHCRAQWRFPFEWLCKRDLSATEGPMKGKTTFQTFKLFQYNLYT